MLQEVVLGGVSIISGIAFTFVFYPKYVLKAMALYFRYKHGFKAKSARLNSSLTMTYMERGSAKCCPKGTIVFIHGFTGSKDGWVEVAKRIPKEYHIVALDLPGHGDSTRSQEVVGPMEDFADAVKKCIDLISIGRKFHLVGTSMGGHIVGLYASLHPEDILSLSLWCPAGIKTEARTQLQIEWEDNKRILLMPTTKDEVAEMFQSLFHKKIQLPFFFLNGVLHSRQEAGWFYHELIKTWYLDLTKQFTFEACLHKINTPTWVVWGKQDAILHVDSVPIIASKLGSPPKRVDVIDGAGHALFMEKAALMALYLLEFIESL